MFSMKRFIRNIILFAVLLAACDVVVGAVMRHLVRTAKYGVTKRYNEIADSITDDILLFGSSLGRRNYNPDILSDSLGMSFCSCAQEKGGILMMYGRYKLIRQRYTPRVVLYDVERDYDLLDEDCERYLMPLRYYYDRPGIDSLFAAVSPRQRLLMLSQCYRYSEDPVQVIGDQIRPNHEHHKGYSPRPWGMNPKRAVPDTVVSADYSELKLDYLERFLAESSAESKVVLLISPGYGASSDSVFEPVKQLARRHGLPLINHYCDTAFTLHPEFYYDPIHLNSRGADRYSRVVAGELHSILNRQ